MATSRQRDAVAPAPTAKAGPGKRNAAAARRPDTRNRRVLVDLGNRVRAPIVGGEANRQVPESARLPRSIISQSAQPNAAMADENAIVPTKRVGGAVLDENKEPSKAALMKRVVATEAKAAKAVEETQRKNSKVQALLELVHRYSSANETLMKTYNELDGVCRRYQMLMIEGNQNLSKALVANMRLHAMLDEKESELQKVTEFNLRLLCDVDKKEAQLQAMSEQYKILALNNSN